MLMGAATRELKPFLLLAVWQITSNKPQQDSTPANEQKAGLQLSHP